MGFFRQYYRFGAIAAVAGAFLLGALIRPLNHARTPDQANTREAPSRRRTQSTHADAIQSAKLPSHGASAKRPAVSALTPEQRLAEHARMIVSATDSQQRRQLSLEMIETNHPAAALQLARLAADSRDPELQMMLLESIQQSEKLTDPDGTLAQTISQILRGDSEDGVKRACEDVLGALPTAASAQILKDAFESTQALPEEKINAAENLLRVATLRPSLLSASDTQKVIDQIRLEAQAASDPESRAQAFMTLGERRNENTAFFRQMLDIERDGNVRNLLVKLIGGATATVASQPTGTR
ncbi:MAG: hypothetical protein K1X53_08885 [Candidatus Sumerlaeaceae bacterium]|nr:hypothetical protein [Candidatus Sumerlaeaceae bacterium]